ncbi:helix-turn-helix domain-containing protein [Microbacterium sp.]|uniref:arsenate reductase/protein-tyrosine-phosphatase family protein n=1 Tax=Microbacterium sp. TaxID=51671 RepID=UPI003241C457
MTDLHRRSEAFAALADPSRLRVVDLLTVSDLSPGEISSRLGMASNLVAFHVRVLEERGIVRRIRSEGDKRRTYLRFVPEVFESMQPAPVRVSGRVIFVCTANSARSQLAEALWPSVSDVPAISAGTDPGLAVNKAAVAAARRHGLELSRAAHPKSLDAVYESGDFLISVCDRAHERLAGRDDAHWSIPDPAPVATAAAFDRTVGELRGRLARFAPRVTAS